MGLISWVLFGPEPKRVADPSCSTCKGRGNYGGLRAFPGDPGSGVAPIACACVRAVPQPENRPWKKGRGQTQQPRHPTPAEVRAEMWAAQEEQAQRQWRSSWLQQLDRRDGIVVGYLYTCCGERECICGRRVEMPLPKRMGLVAPRRPEGWTDGMPLPNGMSARLVPLTESQRRVRPPGGVVYMEDDGEVA